MKSLSIIILTYNQQQFTIDCLTSLGDLLDDESIEVILVDNGSSDGTVEAVKRRFPQVTLIENPVNSGVSGGRQLGLSHAGGDVLMFLDNDTVASPQAVRTLHKYITDHRDAGLCGCRLVGADGTVQESYKAYPGLGVKIANVLGLKRKKDTFPVDEEGNLLPTYVIGACQLFRREVMEAVGPLDTHIFYGPEDADYCLRIAAHGWKIVYIPTVTITHYFQRATTRSIFSKLGRAHIKGLIHFYRKHKRLW